MRNEKFVMVWPEEENPHGPTKPVRYSAKRIIGIASDEISTEINRPKNRSMTDEQFEKFSKRSVKDDEGWLSLPSDSITFDEAVYFITDWCLLAIVAPYKEA